MSNLRLLDPVFSNDSDTAVCRFFSPALFEGEPAAPKMRIDVTENDQAFTVKADIPGMKRHVRINGNVVSIDAETRSEKEGKGNGDGVLRSERYYGAGSRTFSLGPGRGRHEGAGEVRRRRAHAGAAEKGDRRRFEDRHPVRRRAPAPSARAPSSGDSA